jgi:TPR repeat protein
MTNYLHINKERISSKLRDIFISCICTVLFFIYLPTVKADELSKKALDGDPAALCDYAFTSEMKDSPYLKWHSYALGNISCEMDKEHHQLLGNHSLINIAAEFGSIEQLEADAEGSADKQFLIWSLYANGYDVPKLKAFTWLKVAAENNHPGAQLVLGVLYTFGYIVPESKKQGLVLIKKSKDQGYAFANDIYKFLND